MDTGDPAGGTNEILSDSSDIRNCKFEFECPKLWKELAPIVGAGADIRFCGACEQKVYRCRTDNEIALAIKANRCIAIKLVPRLTDGDEPYLLGVPASPYDKTY